MKHSNHTNIPRLLLLFVGVAAGITIISATLLQFVIRASERDHAALTARVLQTSAQNYSLLESACKVQSKLQEMLRLKDPDELEKVLAQVQADQAALHTAITSGKTEAASVEAKWKALATAQKRVLDKILVGDSAAASELFLSDLSPLHDAMLAELKRLASMFRKALSAQSDAAQARTHQMVLKRFSVVVVLLIVLVVFGVALRRRLVSTLAGLTGQLSAASDSVANASGQFAASSQSLAEGASEQASTLEQTGASLGQLGTMAQANTAGAEDAQGHAAAASQQAREGLRQMAEMATAIEAIQSASRNVAQIVKAIDDVAFQTNLLALNAAVEAARAGERGAGFAIVANQVRMLAQRSAEASRESSLKIEECLARTREGVDLALLVQQSLSTISGKTQLANDAVARITLASREQSQAIAQVTQAIQEVQLVTQNTAAQAEQSSSSSQELQGHARSLREMVVDLGHLIGTAHAVTGGGDEARSDAPARSKSISRARNRSLETNRPRPATPDAEMFEAAPARE